MPGATPPDELAYLFADVATLAARLDKPLSCRVWPKRGAAAGDAVRFHCPFFVASAVLAIRPADARAAAARGWRRAALAAAAAAAALAALLALRVVPKRRA